MVPSFGKLSRSVTVSRKSSISAHPLNFVGRGEPVECQSSICSSPSQLQQIRVKQPSSTRSFHSQSPKSLPPSIVSTRYSAPTRLAGSAASLSLQSSQIDPALPLPTPSHVAEAAKRIQIAFDSLSTAPPGFVLSEPREQSPSGATHKNLRSTARPAPPGIFSLPGLTSPSSFRDLARRAVARGGAIVDRVVATAEDPAELVHIVKRLDRLSDEVCAVVDAAEVVRSLHPDAAWREAADNAHGDVSALLNRLNTHRELYEALDRATSNPTISRTWSPTELRVAHLLLADFRRSGIHIRDPAKLSLFASLNDRILALSHKVARGANEPSEPFVLFTNPWKDLAGCGSPFIREAVGMARKVLNTDGALILTAGSSAPHVLRTCRNPATRRRVYEAYHASSEEQIGALESMLKDRARLARETGFPSYADAFLEGTMAGSRHVVEAFLDGLNSSNMPRALDEVAELGGVKRARGEDGSLAPWDRAYLQSLSPRMAQPARNAFGAGSHAVPIAEDPSLSAAKASFSALGFPHLTLGTALSRASLLLHALYGVHLDPVRAPSSELWHPSVIRIDAIHEVEGYLGTVYVDAIERPGKTAAAAHYTVRCGRRLDWDSNDDAWLPVDAVEAAVVEAASQGRGAGGEGGVFKMPLVVVAVNMSKGGLGEQDVETLFHEMGHAVHSLLAKPPFQHVSGTRCSLDLVELPSILHELFTPLSIPNFPAPTAVPPLDLQHQIRLAALDQRLHGNADHILSTGWSSVVEAADVRRTHDAFSIAGTENDTWHARFAHLAAYGAGYYSYLWSRRWAGRVHRDVFGGHVFGSEGFREAGERFRREVLEWGGGRDGWECVEALGVVEGGEREGAVSVEEVGG